jgi:hypothetical protein
MKDYEVLQQHALNFWPIELSEKEKKASIIPQLIASQDKFISLLNIADATPFSWKNTIEQSKSLPANLFLKHLMVLSDVGGERLERFKNELQKIFPTSTMSFVWEGHTYTYTFQALHTRDAWNNKNLSVDGEHLHLPQSLTPLIEDVSMLLLFGSAAIADTLPQEILDKCILGTLLGKKDELDTFVRQRYIWVSRITGGATANTMGQLAQAYIIEHLKNALPQWDFSSKHIPEISQNDGRTPIGFDIVACFPNGVYCAIEVSFQVTTNSTIERKAGQAQARYQQLHEHGHSIAYVIDGAGNFKRKSALSTIMHYSDCTVTFQSQELYKLVQFLIELGKM